MATPTIPASVARSVSFSRSNAAIWRRSTLLMTRLLAPANVCSRKLSQGCDEVRLPNLASQRGDLAGTYSIRARLYWVLAAPTAVVVLLLAACGGGSDLPSGPILSDDDCGALQERFDLEAATNSRSVPGSPAFNETLSDMDRIDGQLQRGGCYATVDVRADMLERDGRFGTLSEDDRLGDG